jgi:hypothetical protein
MSYLRTPPRANLVESPGRLALVRGFENGAADHQNIRARLAYRFGAIRVDATCDGNPRFQDLRPQLLHILKHPFAGLGRVRGGVNAYEVAP